MCERRRLFHRLAMTAVAVAAASLAAAQGSLPHRYNPAGLDGAPVLLESAIEGRTWAAWAYRVGSEFDIAVSFRDESGLWSEPEFLGENDRADQITPALAVDSRGTLYLAYVERPSGRVLLRVLPLGAAEWLPAAVVTASGERGCVPALSVVSDRLVVAFRTFGGSIAIRHVPLYAPPAASAHGINDGPDGIDPLGSRDGGQKDGSGVLPGRDKKGEDK